MSHYGELLGRFNKSLTLLDNSGLDMRVIRDAQRYLNCFEDLRAEAEEALPRLRKALSQAEKECEDWLEKVTSSSSEMIQEFEAISYRKRNFGDARSEIERKISDLQKEISCQLDNMRETASVVAAQQLVRQFEKFEQNVQLPLQFEQLQKEYVDACEAEKEEGAFIKF